MTSFSRSKRSWSRAYRNPGTSIAGMIAIPNRTLLCPSHLCRQRIRDSNRPEVAVRCRPSRTATYIHALNRCDRGARSTLDG